MADGEAGEARPRYAFAFGTRATATRLCAARSAASANLAEMARIGLLVPPGFTISTEICARYYDHDRGYPPGVEDAVRRHLASLENVLGKRVGDIADPLLALVRSGTRDPMPGMTDTTLNLGPNDETAAVSPSAPATNASPSTAAGVSSKWRRPRRTCVACSVVVQRPRRALQPALRRS